MLLEEALTQYLLGKPAIAAIVGDRICPLAAAQGEDFPRIVYRRLTGRHGHDLDGASGDCLARIELRCQAKGYLAAKRLAEAVRNAMDGFIGHFEDIRIYFASISGELDYCEPVTDGTDSPVDEAIVDYLIHHQVSLPTL